MGRRKAKEKEARRERCAWIPGSHITLLFTYLLLLTNGFIVPDSSQN